MELDEMKLAWQKLDRRLERLTMLELGRRRETQLEAAQRSLRSLSRGQITQIVAGGILCLLFAPYWIEHRDVLHLALYGLSLHAYGLMFIGFAVRALVFINRIDYAAPVLQIQQRLAELARWKLRVESPAFAIVGCFLWIPLTLVVFKMLGADIWKDAPEVVYGFIASGFVCLGIGVLVMRAVDRADEGQLARGWAVVLRNSTIGRSIRLAQAQLEEIRRFERD